MKRLLTILLLATICLTSPVWAKPKALSLGKISLGQSVGKLTRLLGQPSQKSDIVEEAATGESVQTWSYPELGLEIDISPPGEKEPFTVYRVTATEPCDLRGYMGLNIGAFAVEVQALARKLEKEPDVEVTETEDGGYTFLWTDTYQMLSVSIAGGKVSQIYMGPGPE